MKLGEPIEIKAIESAPDENAANKKTMLELQFSLWRWHLWGLNYGSYNTIERKVKKGLLTPFVCPKSDCNCKWEKV